MLQTFNPYSLPPLVSSVLFLLLGVFVLLKNKKSTINITFFLVCFLTFWWQFSWFFLFNTNNEETALLLVRIGYAGIILIPAVFFHFFTYFLGTKGRLDKWVLYFAYITSSLFEIILFSTNYFVIGYNKFFWGYYPKVGVAHLFYLLLLVALLVRILFLLNNSLRNKDISHYKYYQVKYCLWGIIFYSLASVDFLTNYGFRVYPFGFIFISIFLGIIAYSIIRYRLMDIRVITRKILIYLGVSVVAYGTFYIVLWFENNFLSGSYSNQSYLIGIVLAGLFVVLFQRSSKGIEKLANKYLFFSLYNYQETINRVSDQLTHYTDLTEISNLVNKTIKESLGVALVEISLFGKNNRLAKKDPLLKYLQTNQRPVVLEELLMLASDERLIEEQDIFKVIYEQIKKLGAAICLPMVSSERLIGIIIIGPKIINDPFTVEDLELLMTLSNQAAIAIDNAELYKEVKDFNKTLKQKVNEQTMTLQDKTKVLEEQAEHLKKLLAMRSEFLDIASHQLKTPISVISGTISMFKEGSVQKMPVETQNHLIDNIYQKSLKISQIIRDILQASEFDTEKFSFVEKRIVPVDLNKVLTDVIADNQAFATEKKLQLIFTPNPANPKINSDPDYLEQALFNLVDNALKYTKEGKVEVLLDENPQSIIIKVKDTGVGIPKDDQGRMFGKFERATNAVDMYTDGSGLGLFITREVIQAHPGGTITFTSEEGKGTEFIITIPKTKK
jgi:signal transduction histidine kinase